MLTTVIVAAFLVSAVQVLLVVMAADRLPADAITGREANDAVLPRAGRPINKARDEALRSAGRYARAA